MSSSIFLCCHQRIFLFSQLWVIGVEIICNHGQIITNNQCVPLDTFGPGISCFVVFVAPSVVVVAEAACTMSVLPPT